MQKQQQAAINYLSSNCYTVNFSKKQFTNHAKFALFFHICFSEGIVHYGEYYGSTNLTQVGLGLYRNKGNYEEFNHNYRPKYSLANSDISFLKNIYELMKHKSLLYTSKAYLTQNLTNHIETIDATLIRVQETISRDFSEKDIGTLFTLFTDTGTIYGQTLALLDDLPGKRLTQPIIDKLLEMRPPINPIELEMVLSEPEFAEAVARDLDLNIESLSKKIDAFVALIMHTRDLITNNYEPYIHRVEEYFDKTERDFSEYLRLNSEMQAEYLKKALSFRRTI